MSEEKIVVALKKKETKSFAKKNRDFLIILGVAAICVACGLIGASLIFVETKQPSATNTDLHSVKKLPDVEKQYEDNFGNMNNDDRFAMTPKDVIECARLLGVAKGMIDVNKTPKLPDGCAQTVILEPSLKYLMVVNPKMVNAEEFYRIYSNLRPRPLYKATIEFKDIKVAYAMISEMEQRLFQIPVNSQCWDMSLIMIEKNGVKLLGVEVFCKANWP